MQDEESESPPHIKIPKLESMQTENLNFNSHNYLKERKGKNTGLIDLKFNKKSKSKRGSLLSNPFSSNNAETTLE